MLEYLRHLFTTPSAYVHNWRGFLANQAGHGAIGLVAASIPQIGWLAIPLYAVLWEWQQYRYAMKHRQPVLLSDCIGDLAYVSTGVFAVLFSPWILTLWIFRLTEGVLVRRGR